MHQSTARDVCMTRCVSTIGTQARLMFAIPGIVGLILLIYVRPQEFAEPLQSIPLLYLCFGLWLFGFIVDLKIGNLSWQKAPQLPLAVALLLYAAITIL